MEHEERFIGCEFAGHDGKIWPHTFDGQTWAREFIRRVKENPEIATDEGTMVGWFANAIMVGYDKGQKDCENAFYFLMGGKDAPL